MSAWVSSRPMDVSEGACEPVGLWTTSTRDSLGEMYSLYNIQPYNHNHNHGNEPIYNISATKGNRPFADGRHALAGVAIYNTQDTSIYIYIYVYIYIYINIFTTVRQASSLRACWVRAVRWTRSEVPASPWAAGPVLDTTWYR